MTSVSLNPILSNASQHQQQQEDTDSSEPLPVIEVMVANHDTCLIWKAEDAWIVRTRYRITGALVGCLPRHSMQNQVLSLPMYLTADEVTLLLSKGLVRLTVDDASRYAKPTTRDIAAYQKLRDEDEKQQLEVLKADRLARETEYRQKRVKLTDEAAKDQSEIPETTEQLAEKEKRRLASQSSLSLAVQVPLPIHPHPALLSRHPKPAQWKYPSTEAERIRCRIFADLWERGYHLTSASKFGGDFLVYPGDPFRYHSHYVAIIVPWNKVLSPLDIVSFGRLGTTVKKSPLICSLDDNGEPSYMSVEWTGVN